MIYAFIPARSGSKRLKDKNYLMLKDKRLFEWSIECANNTKKIEKIIFSTDSNKYIEYAKSIRLDKELIIDYRSDLNSSSEIKIFDYLKSDFIKNNTYLNEKDSLLMLLPTQPFRVNKDIDEDLLNIGSGVEISILELSQLIKKIIGYDGDLTFDKSMPDGNPRKLIDSSKIMNLGWKPKIELEEGIQLSYEWFYENKT